MAINTFSDRIVRRLNELAPNDDWVTAHWMNNQRPWVRIFKQSWVDHWLSSTLRRANRNGEYSTLWFELKCLTISEGHNGHSPFAIYLPLDERGINLGTSEFIPISGSQATYLPCPDTYRKLLLCLSGSYQANLQHWAFNVSNSVNTYLQARYYVLADDKYVLPQNSVRVELDSGLITIQDETDEEVEFCVDFILSRAPTIESTMIIG